MKIMARTLCVAAAALQLLCGVSTVRGHGFLTAPKVEFFTQTEDPTAYSATIDGPTALPVPDGMHYGWGPSVSAEAFTAAFGNSSYKTLREFVMKHQTMEASPTITPECGRTKEEDVPAQPLPNEVVWQHGDNEGFTLSHEGPCEVWCDNERVFVEKNCAKTYPDIPAVLPYKRAKCEGKKRLQIVWLALHDGTRWQVYMNCAPIASQKRTKSPRLRKTRALASAAGPVSTESTTVNNSSTAQAVGSLAPETLPGTVKPSAGQGDEAPTPVPTKQASPSQNHHPTTSKPPKTHWQSKSPKTRAPTESDDDDADCSTKKPAHIGGRPSHHHIPTFRPVWYRPNPIIELQELRDVRSVDARKLEAASPTPQPTKPTVAQGDMAPTPAPTEQASPSKTPYHPRRKTSEPASTSKTLKPSKSPKTRAPTGQAVSTEGSTPGIDSDDFDCSTKKPVSHIGGLPVPRDLGIPRFTMKPKPKPPIDDDDDGTKKPTGFIEQQRENPAYPRPPIRTVAPEDREPRPDPLRKLEAVTPTPQPTKPTAGQGVPAPTPAPTKQDPHPKTSEPASTPKTLEPSESHKTTQGASAEGSASGSDDDDCDVKKPVFHIGGLPGHHHFPTFPPPWFRPKPIYAAQETRDVRPVESRKLEAATPAPQVINWKNGLQEAIAPHIAEKARADFEANERNLEQWRDKVKKMFGYR